MVEDHNSSTSCEHPASRFVGVSLRFHRLTNVCTAMCTEAWTSSYHLVATRDSSKTAQCVLNNCSHGKHEGHEGFESSILGGITWGLQHTMQQSVLSFLGHMKRNRKLTSNTGSRGVFPGLFWMSRIKHAQHYPFHSQCHSTTFLFSVQCRSAAQNKNAYQGVFPGSRLDLDTLGACQNCLRRPDKFKFLHLPTPETFYRFCHSEMGHVSRQNDPGVSHLTQVSIASTTSSRLRVGRPPALPSTIPYACALAAEIDTDNNHRNRFLDYARISRKND